MPSNKLAAYNQRRTARLGRLIVNTHDDAEMLRILRSVLALYTPSTRTEKNIERDVGLVAGGLHQFSTLNDIYGCVLLARNAPTTNEARHRLLAGLLTKLMRDLAVFPDDALTISTDIRGRVLILKVFWRWVPSMLMYRAGVEAHFNGEFIAHDTHQAWVSSRQDAHENTYKEHASQILSYGWGRW